MKIVLASNNKGKLKEIVGLFKEHTILLPRDLGIDYYYEEVGATLLENAFGKAKHLYGLLKEAGIEMSVLADDSGLFVEALGGEPGIRSARYGAVNGKKLSDKERNVYLLNKLKGKPDRGAYFLCCMVLIKDENRFVVAQERFDGKIIDSPRGEGGFGYDPIFYVTELGKTVAELPEGEKNRVSHRARAARVILKTLD